MSLTLPEQQYEESLRTTKAALIERMLEKSWEKEPSFYFYSREIDYGMFELLAICDIRKDRRYCAQIPTTQLISMALEDLFAEALDQLGPYYV